MIKKESQIKLCECGCGQPAPIAKGTNKKRGYKKGQPTRFISGHNPQLLGSDHPNWTGGKVEVSCAQCGKKIFRKPSIVKRTKISFCSKKCRGKYLSIHTSGKNSPIFGINNANWAGGKIEVFCSQCGKPLYRYKARVQNAKHFFCNSECFHKWQSVKKKYPSGVNHPRWKGGKIEVACAYCNSKLYRKGSKIKNTKNHFCNRKCMGAWYSKNNSGENNPQWKGGYSQIFCIQCGKQFKKRPSMIEKDNNYFCSKECASAWRVIHFCGESNSNWKGGLTKFICDQCGKPFERKPSVTKKYILHFCSKDCEAIWKMINWRGENSPAWRGGLDNDDYCVMWTDKDFKEYILERDGYKCQNPDCWGTSKRLARHHINFNKKDCTLENLICLCTSCNSRANSNRDWHTAYYQAIMAKRFPKRRITNEIQNVSI